MNGSQDSDMKIPLSTDGVDLADKNSIRCLLLSHAEQLPNKLWTTTEVLLNQFWRSISTPSTS